MSALSQLFSSFTTTSNLISTPTAPTGVPPKCRFRLDDDSSDTFTLTDGRKLGYAQYGSLIGNAIFYLHGLPGSRAEGAYFHELGLELGARIIATDRPGYGLSSPHPGRTLLDFPKDLECLAKHLGLEEYAVLVCSTRKSLECPGLLTKLNREYQEADHTRSPAQHHPLAKNLNASPSSAA